VFALEEVGEAVRLVQSNAHVGKVGVRCLASEDGLGIEDEAMRETIGEPRLKLFREVS
jgi:crotonyl-CoA reductase